jgi:hypothetical protein
MTNPSRRTFLRAALGTGASITGVFASAPNAAADGQRAVQAPLTGTITAVKPRSRTLNVRSIAHSRDVVVVLNAKAVVWMDHPATLADLAVGDRLAVTGEWQGARFVAAVVEPLYSVAPGRYIPGSGVWLGDREATVGADTVVESSLDRTVGRAQDVMVTYRIDGRTGAALAYRIGR